MEHAAGPRELAPGRGRGPARRRARIVAAAVVAVVATGAAAGACLHHSPPPLHPRAVALQADAAEALARGDLDGATGLFSLALEYEPRMAEAENGLGLVALRYGHRERAERHFRAALALDEDL